MEAAATATYAFSWQIDDVIPAYLGLHVSRSANLYDLPSITTSHEILCVVNLPPPRPPSCSLVSLKLQQLSGLNSLKLGRVNVNLRLHRACSFLSLKLVYETTPSNPFPSTPVNGVTLWSIHLDDQAHRHCYQWQKQRSVRFRQLTNHQLTLWIPQIPIIVRLGSDELGFHRDFKCSYS